MKENIEPINKDDYFLDENGNILNEKAKEVVFSHVPKRKSKKQWYNTTSVRDYITGRSDDILTGEGARSLERAAKDYQHLSEDFSRHVYSPKFMARKYDKFGGIDLDLIDLSIKNAEKEYNSAKTKFESGEISEKEFNKITEKYQRTLNNLNENYKSLYEVWHGKNGIPLVRTQSSVSSLPFMAGIFGLPAAIIGGAESLPFMGSAGSWLTNLSRTGIQNKFVKDILIGSTVGMTGDQLVREFTPYDGIADGLVKEGAKLYYDLKHPDRERLPYEGFEKYLKKDGHIDWDAWEEGTLKEAKINENKDYQNFLNGNAYLPLTFAAEFLNPLNWVNPVSMASKIGLSRSFDNLGNTVIDGFKLDPINMYNDLYNRKGLYTELSVSPQEALNIFESHPNLKYINNHSGYFERPSKVTPLNIWYARRQLNKAKKNMEIYGGEYLKPYFDEALEKLNTLKYGKLFPFNVGPMRPITKGPFNKITGMRFDLPEMYVTYSNGVPEFGAVRKTIPELLIKGTNFEYLGGYDSVHNTFADGKIKLGTFNNELKSAIIANISDNPNLLVDSEGNINFAGYENLKAIIAQKLNKSKPEIETLLKSDGLEDHLLRSAYTAQTLPLPKGINRQELVLGALLHDVGRLGVAVDNGSAHAEFGRNLLAGVNFEGMNDDILNAVKYHMDRESLNAFTQTGNQNGINYPLLQAVSAADVLRGMHYNSGRVEYPYLFGYEVENPIQIPNHSFEEQMLNINKFLESKGYPKINLGLSRSKQLKLLQDRIKQANTSVRGVKVESGGDDVVANFDVKNDDEILDILATTPVRRFNGQHATFDDSDFGKFIGLNKLDNGTVYHSNKHDFSSGYGTVRTIRRGAPHDYDILPGETPYQYVERLMPLYLKNYKLHGPTVPWQQNEIILPEHIRNIIIPENVKKLYKKFGLDENVSKLNYYGKDLIYRETVPAIHHDYYITDYPHFRQNMLIRTGPYAGAYVGPFYNPAFHMVKGGKSLTTFKKHGGKLAH